MDGIAPGVVRLLNKPVDGRFACSDRRLNTERPTDRQTDIRQLATVYRTAGRQPHSSQSD